jgi:hypothetical protein
MTSRSITPDQTWTVVLLRDELSKRGISSSGYNKQQLLDILDGKIQSKPLRSPSKRNIAKQSSSEKKSPEKSSSRSSPEKSSSRSSPEKSSSRSSPEKSSSRSSPEKSSVSSSSFSSLPIDMLETIALELDVSSLSHLCSTNKSYSQLCNKDAFWKRKFAKDFGIIYDKIYPTWKEEYVKYGIVMKTGAEKVDIQEFTKLPNIIAKQIACGDKTLIRTIHDNVIDVSNGVVKDINDKPIKAKFITSGRRYSALIDENDHVWINDSYGKIKKGFEKIPNDIKAKHIACDNHIAMIDMDGNVWTYGNNRMGQLGLGDQTSRDTFTQVPNISAVQVFCGVERTAIIDKDGVIKICGYNGYGQLGVGDIREKLVFTTIPDIKAKKIVCGDEFTLVIDEHDQLFAVGYDEAGALGVKKFYSKTFIKITDINVKDVSCGIYHTAFISTDHDVYVSGLNDRGQLGVKAKRKNAFGKVKGIKARHVECGVFTTYLIL